MGFRSNHKAVIGIQARMSSMRFPGKVLAKLQGKTIIEHVVNACLNLDIPCFVLTSKEPNDDQLVAFLKNRKIDSYRGDLNNVLSRFKSFTEEFDFDEIVRISADSPLMHHEVIKKVFSQSQNLSESEIVTNIFPRSFPKGESVEKLSLFAMVKMEKLKLSKSNLEHVTSYIYENPVDFEITNVSNEIDLSHLSLCVDTPADLLRLDIMLEELDISLKDGLPEWKIFSQLLSERDI
jgi:spore coat polysaccharide biosynthesis protein SpsF (cytidylyltransferase family)